MLSKKLLLLILFFLPARAVFVGFDYLSNGKQHIYFFEDVHKPSPVSQKQQIEVASLAKELGATLLTEEMVDIGTLRNYVTDEKLLAQIELDCMDLLKSEESSQFSLRGLALFARSLGCDAFNVDYRQWADPFRCGRSITGFMAVQVLGKVLKEIASYDDNAIFNDYYKKSYDMVTGEFGSFWLYLCKWNVPISKICCAPEFYEIVASLYNPAQNEYSEFWAMYDSCIFNCLLLHKLAQSTNEHIIICAGEHHSQQLKKILISCGYGSLHAIDQLNDQSPIEVKKLIEWNVNRRIADCVNMAERKKIIAAQIELIINKNRMLLKR
jgi:hypothetical protein